MKIYLSCYWRQSVYFLFGFIILAIIGTIIFCVWSKGSEDYIFALCAIPYILVPIGIILGSKRFLTYSIVNEKTICSYSFTHRFLCKIDLAISIYYTVFETLQGGVYKQFIVLSNESFEYQPTYGMAKVRFIQHYNIKKQIILPYDERTIPLFNLKDWHNVD